MSIIDDKYKGKGPTQDFVSGLINKAAARTKTVEQKVAIEGTDKVKTVKVDKPDGIDIDALFELAAQNSLDVAKFEPQRATKNFAGRFRMTLANMLRAAARKRHGLFDVKGKWNNAPAEFLAAAGIAEGDKPTHDRKGVAVAKPAAKPKGDAAATAAA